MRTVLGLSVTSHGIAWALVGGDGRTTDLTPLDDDAFDVDAADDVTAWAAAAARSAQAIGAASGQNLAAVGVCAAGLVSDHGDDPVARLLDLLAAAGFDDVRIVPGRPDTTARAAAEAVATNAVARTPRPAASRAPAPAPRRRTAARAVAAAAAAIAAGLLTVGSQSVEPVPGPAADDADISAAAEPQLVTVSTPRGMTRAVTESPAEPDVEPVSMVEPAAPAPSQTQTVPIHQPVAVTVPHHPAAEPHLPVPAAQPHMAADPSPGPGLPAVLPAALPGPAVPVAQPSPAPVAGLWFLGAMP
ncbi:hypothetical protein [Mycobacterium sp. DL440]|uniref:hypothetical protein n=1 Tax=Mycobacterium sp. DL440 TaxID=2675523 RepID=UPI00142342E7|nr:hypothetical protein [Mycobacterium sp. DL440]